jgi:hypothetical protein
MRCIEAGAVDFQKKAPTKNPGGEAWVNMLTVRLAISDVEIFSSTRIVIVVFRNPGPFFSLLQEKVKWSGPRMRLRVTFA